MKFCIKFGVTFNASFPSSISFSTFSLNDLWTIATAAEAAVAGLAAVIAAAFSLASAILEAAFKLFNTESAVFTKPWTVFTAVSASSMVCSISFTCCPWDCPCLVAATIASTLTSISFLGKSNTDCIVFLILSDKALITILSFLYELLVLHHLLLHL